MRQCPKCKSLNVRRASLEHGASRLPLFRSPYRCRDCQTKFWALSTRAYQNIILVVVLNAVFLALMIAFMLSISSLSE
jgi:transposase-like protein